MTIEKVQVSDNLIIEKVSNGLVFIRTKNTLTDKWDSVMISEEEAQALAKLLA